MQHEGQHHVNWTGPGTSAGLTSLLESHLTLELPGSPPVISSLETRDLDDTALDNPKLAEGAQSAPLPYQGTRVTFQDVEYIVRNQANRREKLKILSQVSGYFNPGEMAAVMGPSGSGNSQGPSVS